MIKNFNYFKNLKEFYKFAFENFKFISEQQQKMIDLFIDAQPAMYKDNIKKIYEEWNKNAEKAFEDYRDMVFKGLDYLEGMYDKMSQQATKKNK